MKNWVTYSFLVYADHLNMIFLFLGFALSFILLIFMVEILCCSSSILFENRIILCEHWIELIWFLFVWNFCVGIWMSSDICRHICKWCLGLVFCFDFFCLFRWFGIFFLLMEQRGYFFYCFKWLQWAINCMRCVFSSLYIREFPWIAFLCKY